MKRIVFLSLALLLSAVAFSQGLFGTLTEKYASQEGFSATNLTRDMFDLYLKKKQVEENSPVYETLKKLNNILVVSQSALAADKSTGKGAGATSEIHQTILNYYKNQSFTLFKTENRMGEDLKFFLKKNGEKITALSLVTATATRLTLVELDGDIDLSTVSELNKALNIKGLENLYRINGQSGSVAWGAGSGEYSFNFSEEQQKQIQQQAEELRNLADEKSREFSAKNFEFSQQQREMVERYRELAEKYQRQPIFLSMPGDTNIVYYIDGKKVEAPEVKKINPDQIETIEVIKPSKEKPGKKGEIRIKTKK